MHATQPSLTVGLLTLLQEVYYSEQTSPAPPAWMPEKQKRKGRT
jgi:hypothetical protein